MNRKSNRYVLQRLIMHSHILLASRWLGAMIKRVEPAIVVCCAASRLGTSKLRRLDFLSRPYLDTVMNGAGNIPLFCRAFEANCELAIGLCTSAAQPASVAVHVGLVYPSADARSPSP